MMKTIAFAALSLTVGTAAIAGEPEKRFTRDGQTYAYIVESAPNGQVIRGRTLPQGQSFRLFVRDGRVTGVTAGRPVAFRVADAKAPVAVAAAD